MCDPIKLFRIGRQVPDFKREADETSKGDFDEISLAASTLSANMVGKVYGELT